jgi:hypothetical protein
MKARVRELIQARDFDALAEMAKQKRRILGVLLSLTFDPDPLLGWRAVEAMGVAARSIAEDHPNAVQEHLRRLYWLVCEESGGVCYRAPEAIAEIVCQEPDLFADYVLIVASLLQSMAAEDLIRFKPGILWAIGRLGKPVRDKLEAYLPTIASALDDPDAQTRGMAAWCLRELGETEPLQARPELLTDESAVELYEEGQLTRTTVAKLANSK